MTEQLGPEDRVTVRTTFRPDQDVKMTATEAEDLRRQGLLVKADQEAPAAEAPVEKEPEARQRPAREAKGEKA